jgi:telomerase protein component 1
VFGNYRYPSTREEFLLSRLPGIYEEEKAGKRMKLPIPETWETQVSLKGNKASTWEDLIGKSFFILFFILRFEV